MLRKAYIFAMEAHGIQKRASGVPYFYHPAEVARLLAELKLDAQTVITGLLHDVLEDTTVCFTELSEIFGSEVAFLVEGVTKLSKINYASSRVHKAENFRKFLLAMSRDIRVLIVKLADRLNNMRTLNYITSIEKRKRVSLETLEVYAPLAERIGMNIIKDEMEELAFYNLHPDEYSKISLQLDQIRNKDNNFVQNTILELKKILKENGIDANISGREKKIYSIWKKMQTRNVSLEQINDIVAFRVIVDNLQQCYMSLGVIHTNFQIVPGRFKDYISIPKLNNYRSLHTTVIGPLKQSVEIQIRTEEMHRVADEGVAAHWFYKSDGALFRKDEQEKYKWVKNLLTVFQNSSNPGELISHSKLDLFEEEVFCFTPNGDLITLPRGATVIDFAYEIHTAVGNTAVGAKVNNKMVPLKTVLRNGDQVEIITSPSQNPDGTWERFAITSKAKTCIKKFIKTREKKEFCLLGLQLIKCALSSSKTPLSEDMIPFKEYSCGSLDKFYYNIGRGIISLDSIRMILPLSENIGNIYNDSLCITNFIPGVAVHFPACCSPIFGDKVIGVLTPQRGLVVHVTSCNNLGKNKYNFIKVNWTQNDDIYTEFVARLRIVIQNETESFSIITNIISSHEANIINLKVEHRSTDFFDLLVDIRVTDVSHLGDIQAALRTCSLVRSVRRL
jgi:GTP pyrophosphokinase